MKPVYVPHNPHEKAMQKALMMYRKPENYDLVKEALIKAGRQDLIGFDKKCLIRPRKMENSSGHEQRSSHGRNDSHKNNTRKNNTNNKNYKASPQKNKKNTDNAKSVGGNKRHKRK